jgi:hypothetical protein
MQTSPGLAPSPPAPPVKAKRMDSEADRGWDDAVTATEMPDEDEDVDNTKVGARAIETPRSPQDRSSNDAAPQTPQVPPVREKDAADAPQTPAARAASAAKDNAATPLAPPVSAVGARATTAAAAPATLSPAMREEVWTIVRAAVDEAVAPLGARIKELEAKLERAAPAAAKPTTTSTSSASSRLASIPVSMSASAPPPRMDPIPAAAGVPRSIPPTGLGVVVVPPGPRPAIDLEAIAKQSAADIDFNPGGSKRMVGRVVVALMLLAVIGAVVMTILSHNG